MLILEDKSTNLNSYVQSTTTLQKMQVNHGSSSISIFQWKSEGIRKIWRIFPWDIFSKQFSRNHQIPQKVFTVSNNKFCLKPQPRGSHLFRERVSSIYFVTTFQFLPHTDITWNLHSSGERKSSAELVSPKNEDININAVSRKPV